MGSVLDRNWSNFAWIECGALVAGPSNKCAHEKGKDQKNVAFKARKWKVNFITIMKRSTETADV